MPEVSFHVGETILHKEFHTFRITKVGMEYITVRATAHNVARKAPFLVTFKNCNFYVVSKIGRDFLLRYITHEESICHWKAHNQNLDLATVLAEYRSLKLAADAEAAAV